MGCKRRGSGHSGGSRLLPLLKITPCTQSKSTTSDQLLQHRTPSTELAGVCARVCACARAHRVPLLEGELRPSHHWPGAQASQPCVCSCDLSCTSWSGLCNGKIINGGGGGE